MWSRVRPLLLLTAAGLLFFGNLLLHPTQVLYSDYSDLLAMHLPNKRFLVRTWQETGEVPLWCPYSFGGVPFAHDVQMAAFYPLHGPLYVLPEEDVGWAMSWLVVVHVLIAGWCMYTYARKQGLNQTGALVAGLGWMFAGKWLLHVLGGGQYIMAPLAWLPLVLLWQDQAVRQSSLLRATWAGAAFALIVLGTHPQMTFYAGLFVGLWSLGPALEMAGYLGGNSERSWRRTARALGWWLGLGSWTALVAGALSAIQLLPALEAADQTSRAVGVAAGESAFLPALFGLFGPGWVASWEERGGIGVLWLAAACMAPLFRNGRPRFQLAVLAGLLVFALGGSALVQALPGFRLFQLHSRVLVLAGVPVSLLAGQTTQALCENATPELRRRCLRLLLGIVLVALVMAAFTGFQSYLDGKPDEGFLTWARQREHPVWLYWSVVLVGAAVACWLLGRSTVPALLWPAVLLAELVALTSPLVAVRPVEDIYPVSPAVSYLIERDRELQAQADRMRVLEWGLPGLPTSAPLGPALPLLGNVQFEPVLGYNSFDVLRYREYLQLITDEDEPLRPREGAFGYPLVQAFPIRNQPLLDLLGVRYLLRPSDPRLTPAEARPTGWEPVGPEDTQAVVYSFLAGGMQRLPAFRIYLNQNAFPRAFVVPRAAPLPQRSEVLPALRANDFRKTVLLEDWPPPSAALEPVTGEFRPTHIKEYQPNRVVVDVPPGPAGWLVLADVWFPGWQCTVDGKPTNVYRANFLFRGVELSAGAHEVVFTFAPASYRWGKWITALALGGVVGFTVIGLVISLRRRLLLPLRLGVGRSVR